MSKLSESTDNLVQEMNTLPPQFFNTNPIGKKLYRGFVRGTLTAAYSVGFVFGATKRLITK